MDNAYFKGLINGTGSAGGKFDLKQVAEFDRLNKKDEERRSNKAKAKPGKGVGEGKGSGGGGGGGGKYRDRAGERRKQGDTASEMEEAASRLDIEQSKHLGGDMEHTHLVKGLDYTLLQKMRGPPGVPVGGSGPPGMPVRAAGPPGVPVAAALVSSSFSSTTASMSTLARKAQREQEQRLAESDRNTRPITEMGRALKQHLEDRREATSKNSSSSSSSGGGGGGGGSGIGAGGSALQRTQYEFALHDKDDDDDALDSDLPTIINRAKSEIQIDEAVASGEIPPNVLARLVEAFRSLTSSGGVKKRKREGERDKKKEAEAGAPTAFAAHAMLLEDPGMDIFANVGKYVPVGALDPEERDVAAAQSAKGLFGPDLGSAADEAASASASTSAKLQLINAVVTEQERRIELTTLELEKKSAQGFSASSEYDIFPDNVDFENVAGSDDDEDDEETKARKKKSREKLGMGGGGAKK